MSVYPCACVTDYIQFVLVLGVVLGMIAGLGLGMAIFGGRS